MKVAHSLGKLNIEKNIKENTGFILTNKAGGYCYFADKPRSRYHGVFFNNSFKMYKVIDNIRLVNAPSVSGLKNNFSSFERKRENLIEKFFMPYGLNSLVYSLNREEEIELVLDIRESYKMPGFGRNYEILEDNGKLIVKYTQDNEFNCYLAINYDKDYEPVKRWFKQEYELDRKRGSLPFESYVFSAVRFKSKQLVISFSFDKEKAITENDYVTKNIGKLETKQECYMKNLLESGGGIRNKNLRMAYVCAVASLDSLAVSIDKVDGIYAGLPWFFQFWARDEAVSLKSLKYIGKKETDRSVNNILSRLINSIDDNIKIPNKFPNGDVKSCDAAGWVFKRGYELDKKIIEKKIKYFEGINQDSFITNGKKETWMDSIGREGARIELQALSLSILKSLFDLTKDKMYKELEKDLKEKTRKEFWNEGILKDGLNDSTIRPNVFIAAYVYPELLTKAEWAVCFKNTLAKLWLGWGGLSTIDKSNPLFCDTSTGEDPKSYHNGDSWFYLNNLAAFVLYKTDKKIFGKYIKKIFNASSNEILWKGAVGHHAELSSAKMLSPNGCLAQAWSAAMFIELVEELKNKY